MGNIYNIKKPQRDVVLACPIQVLKFFKPITELDVIMLKRYLCGNKNRKRNV